MGDEIESQVRNVIAENLFVDEAEVVPVATLANDLGADSIDAVELVMAFEDEFECDISDEEAEKIIIVQDAVDLVRSKAKKKIVAPSEP